MKDKLMTTCMDIKFNGKVAVLTLNRPPINALDEAALQQMMRTINNVDADEHINVIIITSGIKGIFCTGGDLKYWPSTYPKKADVVSMAGQNLFTRTQELTKLSIAAIDGQVIGDGLSLALACDIRLASRTSTFHLPEVDYGFIPGWGTIGRLIQAVGRSRAVELLLTCETIDAERAESIGLINRTSYSTDVMDSAQRMAEVVAAKPPIAVRYAKAAIYGNSIEKNKNQEDWELKCFSAVWGGSEWKAGIDRLFGK
jgi:enoyl-CoA hydratase/carnithine racemase